MSEPTREPSPATATSDEELLGQLADDFAARRRRGERPTVEEYVARHPFLAERIRNVFLAVGAIEQAVPPDLAPGGERPGSTIGRYKLLERIGEGGFGVVYMAEQVTPVRRKVALKVVKPGMDSRQVLARFDAERQALAIMDHPNIAKVFDGGMTDAGRPYFVMELVKGEPITSYCDASQLPPRQRLDLFVQVCDAVQHAHQKGIIHRDIKPTNVLVMMHDTTPVVKVIDFGVAKALGQALTDETLFTGFAQLVGTPLYMSPEQAGQSALDVDTRSDIYSLGVLLYELLTGTTPFDKERFRKAAHDEIRRIIREEEPPRPSTRLSAAETLASISAQRHTEPAKLTKLVRGELDWIVMKALEKDRGRRYETASGFAADVKRYLNDEPVQACPPSAGYRFRKLARRNTRALAAASAVLAMLLLLVGGLAVSNVRVSRERNEKAAALKDRERALAAAKASADRAESERRRAESNFLKARAAVTGILARAATGQGEWSQLPPRLRKVFGDETTEYYQSLIQEGSADPSVRYDTAVGFRSIGFLHGSAQEYGPAEKYYRQSIQMLEALVSESADNAEYRYQLAFSRSLLGAVMEATTRPTEARSAYEGAAELLEGPIVHSPKNMDYRTLWWKCFDALSRIGDGEGADGELQKHHERAERFLRDWVRRTPGEAAAHHSLGRILIARGKLEESVAAYRKAVVLDPDNARTHYNLGIALSLQKKPGEAIVAYRKANQLDPKYAHAYVNLGNVLWREKKLDEAAAAFRQAIECDPEDSTAFGQVGRARFISPQVAAYNNLGVLLRQQKKPEQAADLYRELIERNPAYAEGYVGLALTLLEQKKLDEAMPAIEKAFAIDPQNAQALNYVAWLLATSVDGQSRSPSMSLALAKKAVELEPKNGAYHNTLGVACYRTGDWNAAIAALERSMELRRGGDSSDWFFLAMARWQLGEKAAAREWYGRAVKWMEEKASGHEELIRFRREAAELLGENVATQPAPSTARATTQPQPPAN